MSDKPSAQLATRREWRLGRASWAPRGRLVAYEETDTLLNPSPIHVREVLPGEVTITREEAEKLFMSHSDPPHTIPDYYPALTVGAALVALFGPRSPEGSASEGGK